MTPDKLIEMHEFLHLYFVANNNTLSRDFINHIKGLPLDSEKHEDDIRYLRLRKFISPNTVGGDKITKDGIDAINSDQLKTEARQLKKELREKYWTNFRSWAAIVISILSLSGTIVLGILKMKQ